MSLLRAPSTLTAFVRRNLIWFLLGCYALAAVIPGPGESLRRVDLGELPFSGEAFNPMHLLLAVLLFCVGVSIRSDESRNLWRLTRTVAGSLAACWLLPVLGLSLLTAGAWLVVDGPAWQAFLAGAILVIAMPPANSSSVWSELSGGPAAAVVTVIILGTLLAPVATPVVVGLFSLLIGDAAVGIPDSTASLLEVLFAFVMLPAALGIAIRVLLDAALARWVASILQVTRTVSLGSLLLLNYGNAAAAMPQVLTSRSSADVLLVATLTLALCLVVFGLALLLSQTLHLRDRGTRLSFVYVTGMKNTGAALVLAATLLTNQPLAILVPVLYTLAQHVAAATIDRFALGVRNRELSPAPATEIPQTSTPSY